MQLAGIAAEEISVPVSRISEVLIERERLGSTGLGGGVAIPHGRLSELKAVHGVFARLTPPLDFDAIDRHPVDLVFVLLSPEDAGADHLKALAKVSRLFRNQTLVEKLRGTSDAEAIYAILNDVGVSQAA